MFFGCFKKFPKLVCSLTDSLRGYGVGFLPCGFWGMISGQADGHVYRLLFACGVCVLKRVWKSKDNLLVPSLYPVPLSAELFPASILFRSAGDEIRALLSPLPLSYSTPFSQWFAYWSFLFEAGSCCSPGCHFLSTYIHILFLWWVFFMNSWF